MTLRTTQVLLWARRVLIPRLTVGVPIAVVAVLLFALLFRFFIFGIPELLSWSIPPQDLVVSESLDEATERLMRDYPVQMWLSLLVRLMGLLLAAGIASLLYFWLQRKFLPGAAWRGRILMQALTLFPVVLLQSFFYFDSAVMAILHAVLPFSLSFLREAFLAKKAARQETGGISC